MRGQTGAMNVISKATISTHAGADSRSIRGMMRADGVCAASTEPKSPPPPKY